MTSFDSQIAAALGPNRSIPPDVTLTGAFALSSIFDVSGLALSALRAAAQELALLTRARTVTLDRRRTELWYNMTLRPQGWTLPDSWDPIAGNYRAQDGWIRLHTNVPAHLAAVLVVLGVPAEREQVAAAVAKWPRFDLEDAVVQSGGVAAAMLSLDDWEKHPQGKAVAAEPLIAWSAGDGATHAPVLSDRLTGLRVLDLTRVLAGPVATRFLAGFGASVLRVDPPDWKEDGLEPEVTLGKACCALDLRQPADRTRFERLLSEAHVLVHGYRPGALAQLGYDAAARRALAPHLVDVSLSAYGWTGPWAKRRGFDSVVQMNTGFAYEAMRRAGAEKPVPLPVQVLDHATGYLMAAAVLRALRMQASDGRARSARLSLARTARLLASAGVEERPRVAGPGVAAEELPEETHWGSARRVAFPLSLDGRGPDWRRPAGPFRTAPPEWPAH